MLDPVDFYSIVPDGFFGVSANNYGGDTITIDLTAAAPGGVQLSVTDAYKVTFLMLPVDQTELTLTLVFADGSTKSLKLKDGDSWVTIPACKKTYFWNIGVPESAGIHCVFTATDPGDLVWSGGTSTAGKVFSYKYNGSDTTAVAWEVEGYYASREDAEAGTNPVVIDSTWISSFTPASTDGGAAGESVTIGYSQGTAVSTSSFVEESTEIRDRLRSNSGAYVQRGSASSYWNLANPSSGSTSSIEETANTYIVNAPGYYCFPLVMGNGVRDNANNATAYRQSNFVNYKGTALTGITSPYLQDQGGIPTTAYIVWEEANCIDVQDETSWELAAPSGTGSAITSSAVGGQQVYWLNFHVGDNMTQGCAVIAVKDAGGEVMWSWTIWFTDYVPRNYPDYPASSDLADKYGFMPRNLGWVETGVSQTDYAESSLYVRLMQTGTSNHAVMAVTKPAGYTRGSGGHCPYYQWGRKDAMIPSNGSAWNDLTPLYGRYNYFSAANDSTTYKKVYSDLIRHPELFFGPQSYAIDTAKVCGKFWDANNTAVAFDITNHLTDYDDYVRKYSPKKTIYDPCPVGYSVPGLNSFSSFDNNTVTAVGSSSEGTYCFQYNGVLFPAAGCRKTEFGELYGVNRNYGVFCWESVPVYGRHDNYYCGFCFAAYSAAYASVAFSKWGRRRRYMGLPIRPIRNAN